jgi:hypothetical protein
MRPELESIYQSAPVVGQVEPSMERRDVRHAVPPGERQVQAIGMEVEDVELLAHREEPMQLPQVQHFLLMLAMVEAHASLRAGHEAGGRDRVARGEQRHVVARAHERLGEEGDDAFRAFREKRVGDGP